MTAARPAIPDAPAPNPPFHEYADAAALSAAVAHALAAALQADRAAGHAPLALLSGGSTPVAAYRALAAAMRDWSGITLALVDDRWVAPEDAGSNARLLRETLQAGAPGGPGFWPLTQFAGERAAAVAQANVRFAASTAAGPPSLVLLGMGDDGHTASLFPGSPDLPAALAAAQAYVALDAHGCPGAGAWPLRITLTPAGWSTARRRLLMLRGAHKRAVFERALREADPRTLPVSAAVAIGAAPLEVHWCP